MIGQRLRDRSDGATRSGSAWSERPPLVRLLVAVLVSVVGAAACAEDPVINTAGLFSRDRSLAENIDGYVTARMQDDFPGVAVRVVHEGAVVFDSAYGRLRRDEPERATTATPFYLAEVSMTFTAAAVLMLVEDGLLELDARVSDLLPDIPSSWDLITVHHLLAHQSGLTDYLTELELGQAGLTNESALEEIKQAPLQMVAGAHFRFSRSDYLVLAEVVEAVSGQPFQDFVQANIFDPLGMEHSVVVDESGPEVPGRPVGYTNLTTISDYELRTMGDGGFYVSADDMGSWLDGLESNALLGSEATDLLYAPNGEGEYGYGWHIGDLLGTTAYFQDGLHRGFRSFVGKLPGADLTIVVLASGAYDWVYELPTLIVLYVLDA